MNKVEVRKLFWKIVNEIEGCCDTVVKNSAGVVVEKGMGLSNGYSIMYNLDEGTLKVCDAEFNAITTFTEDNETLLVLKDLFEALEI